MNPDVVCAIAALYHSRLNERPSFCYYYCARGIDWTLFVYMYWCIFRHTMVVDDVYRHTFVDAIAVCQCVVIGHSLSYYCVSTIPLSIFIYR